MRFFKTEPDCYRGDEEERRADEIGRRIGEFHKEGDFAEHVGVAPCRVGEDAAEDGADDDANVEGHGEEEEGSGLEFLFADDFADPIGRKVS